MHPHILGVSEFSATIRDSSVDIVLQAYALQLALAIAWYTRPSCLSTRASGAFGVSITPATAGQQLNLPTSTEESILRQLKDNVSDVSSCCESPDIALQPLPLK